MGEVLRGGSPTWESLSDAEGESSDDAAEERPPSWGGGDGSQCVLVMEIREAPLDARWWTGICPQPQVCAVTDVAARRRVDWGRPCVPLGRQSPKRSRLAWDAITEALPLLLARYLPTLQSEPEPVTAVLELHVPESLRVGDGLARPIPGKVKLWYSCGGPAEWVVAFARGQFHKQSFGSEQDLGEEFQPNGKPQDDAPPLFFSNDSLGQILYRVLTEMKGDTAARLLFRGISGGVGPGRLVVKLLWHPHVSIVTHDARSRARSRSRSLPSTSGPSQRRTPQLPLP